MKKALNSIIFAIIFFLIILIHNQKNIFAEVVIVHANKAWQGTDIILRGSSILTWQVKEDDYWSFNTELFPEGHTAEGIPVPALGDYALPGENLGMLLGKIGDGRIISMGLSGSDYIRHDEGGNYLYLAINDELFHLYGKGYKDNVGEIKVTITQTPSKTIKIDILFIEGCPGFISTAQYIKDIIADERIDAEITFILIENNEDARRLHFLGSPTVRVNGMDIEKDLRFTKDYDVRSRIYYAEGNKFGYPPKSMIKDAIKKAMLAKEKKY